MVLALAEILSLKKFRQADDLRAPSGGIGRATQGLFQILLRLRPARHLDQGYAKFLRRQVPTSRFQYSRKTTASSHLSALSFQCYIHIDLEFGGRDSTTSFLMLREDAREARVRRRQLSEVLG